MKKDYSRKYINGLFLLKTLRVFLLYLLVCCNAAEGVVEGDPYKLPPLVAFTDSEDLEDSRKWTMEVMTDGKTRTSIENMEAGTDGSFNLNLDGVKGVRMMCRTRERWSGAVTLGFEIDAEAGLPDMMQVVLYLMDGDYCWYEAQILRKPVPGMKAVFSVRLDDPEIWQNIGHGKPLNGYTLSEIGEFGIGIFCEKPVKGKVSIIGPLINRYEGYPDPLSILDFRESSREVGRYGTLELSFRLNRAFENPFDPEQIDIITEVIPPSKNSWQVAGFFTQDYRRTREKNLEELTPEGRPYWAVRIVPREEGTYSYRLMIRTPGDVLEMKPRNFTVVPSERKGHVRVSKTDPCYWEFENGEFFYPIGHSVHASYDDHYHTMQKRPKPVHDTRTFFYDDAFKKMAEAGETFTEIWMCPWWMELEWRGDWFPYKGLGRYNLENAWCLDYLFDLAEGHDIRLQIALMNHGELSYTNSDPDWQDSPYYTKNGGFLKRPIEWFTSDRAQKLWRQKLRYIVSRWGGSTNLFGWVLISESDLVGPYSKWSSQSTRGRKIYTKWCVDTSRYVQSIDPGQHPITNHYYGNYRNLDKNLFRQKEMGYMASDAYRDGSHLIDQLIGTVSLSREIGKPIVISEYGGDWCGATDNNLRAEQHGGIWGAYMIGMTSTPLFWWFEFVHEQDLYGTYRGFSRFIKGEDPRNKPAKTKRLRAALPEDIGTPVHCLARVGEGWLDGWIFEDRALPHINYYQSKQAFYAKRKTVERPWKPATVEGASVAISGFKPGKYTVEFWNTLEGEVVSTAEIVVGTDASIVIKPPVFFRDIAVKVRPAVE